MLSGTQRLFVYSNFLRQSERQGTKLHLTGQLTRFSYLSYIRKLAPLQERILQTRGQGSGPPPGKPQVAVGFLKTLVRIPLEKHLDPLRSFASRGRFVWPSVTLMPEKKLSGLPWWNFLYPSMPFDRPC